MAIIQNKAGLKVRGPEFNSFYFYCIFNLLSSCRPGKFEAAGGIFPSPVLPSAPFSAMPPPAAVGVRPPAGELLTCREGSGI